MSEHEFDATAADILARRPKYMGAWLDTGREWDWKARHELKVLASAGADIDRVADILGRSPTSIAWRCKRDNLALPPAWASLIRRAYKPRPRKPRWTPLAYPYVNFRRAENETLLLVNEMVAHALPGREDVCQDIMLAILERGLTPDRATVNEFVRKFRRENYESGGFALSLDVPVPGTDNLLLIDTLTEADSLWART